MKTDNGKFNILHVVSRLPVGGVETTILNEIRGYDRNRFHAFVCCIKEGGGIADVLATEGYRIEILQKMKGHGFDWGSVITIYRLIKKYKIHILRTHQYHANLYGRIAGIFAGVPVMVSTFQNVYDFPHKRKLHRSLFNHVLGLFSDRLIACSGIVAADMVKYDRVNPEKVDVIYNSVDTGRFQSELSKKEARRLCELPENEVIIGTVGRLDEQKGHRYLIQAATGLLNVRVAIAGDGPLRGELHKLSADLKSSVTFTGLMMHERVPVFLRALDIFCFPSLWEGFGIALAEAMTSGLPVVASDIPPLREVLGDAGILVPAGDAAGLHKALKTLIDDDALQERLRKASKDRAKIFSAEHYSRSYERLFNSLLIKKGLL